MGDSDTTQNVLVVPVIDFAFRRVLEDSIYAFPVESNKRVREYVAFYRSQPVGAITHVGRVETADVGEIDLRYRAICFGDRVEEDPVVVILGEVEALDSPVESTNYGIQGQMYTTLDALRGASTLEDLS